MAKIGWMLVRPSSLLVFLSILAMYRRAMRWGMLSLWGVILVLPVGLWAMMPLENRFQSPRSLPDQITGIVVLGGALDEQLSASRAAPALNDAAERLTEMLRLARLYSDARILFTGGSARMTGNSLREADFVSKFLAQQGIAQGRVQFERDSRNTAENAVFSYHMIQPQPKETWLLVTSASHMPRAIASFKAAGWQMTAWPVDYQTRADGTAAFFPQVSRNLALLDAAFKEYIGLVAYRMAGKAI